MVKENALNLKMTGSLFAAAVLVLMGTLSVPLAAQWPRYQTPGVPKTADGKPDLNAPAPRGADGKPDLSGVWETAPCTGCAPPTIDGLSPPPAQGRGAGSAAGSSTPAPPPGRVVFGNGGAQVEGGPPYQPWAAELVKKRMADNSKDNPDAHCLPMGIMQLTSHPYPKKIIQTAGPPVPGAEAEPWGHGYSAGRGEGDTLVVETSGFMDDGWLDVRGSPLTSAGKLTERFRRVSYGYLEIAVTIDDPKAK